MRHRERCTFWTRPEQVAEIENSLTDAAVSLPPGMMLVYEAGPAGGYMADDARKRVMTAARNVAARLRLALVQWPGGPTDGQRQWLYALQRPTR